MKKIRIVIADNDAGQVEALKTALMNQEDFEVAAIVSTRDSAIKQLVHEPHIVLVNPEVLKQHNLSRFIHSVQAKSSGARVVLVRKDAPSDDNLISEIKAGTRGYIKAAESPANIAKAVRAVHEGEIWAERRILEKAMAKPMILPETLSDQVPGLPPLTTREMEMLTLVLQGATNKEIAGRSNISERTVKTHLYRIYRKLKVKSRTKAMALLSHS